MKMSVDKHWKKNPVGFLVHSVQCASGFLISKAEEYGWGKKKINHDRMAEHSMGQSYDLMIL